eukprot:6836585-Alexandrium_andersonii.AAC.1
MRAHPLVPAGCRSGLLVGNLGQPLEEAAADAGEVGLVAGVPGDEDGAVVLEALHLARQLDLVLAVLAVRCAELRAPAVLQLLRGRAD